VQSIQFIIVKSRHQ